MSSQTEAQVPHDGEQEEKKKKEKQPRYQRVLLQYWASAKRLHLDNYTSLLGIYLRTNAFVRSEGLYTLPRDYMIADLPKAWSRARLTKALEQLQNSDLAHYDEPAAVVFIPDALLAQRSENPNQRISAVNYFMTLPATRLWGRFLAAAERYDPLMLDYVQEKLPERGHSVEWGTEEQGEPSSNRFETVSEPLSPALSQDPYAQDPYAQDPYAQDPAANSPAADASGYGGHR